MQKDNVQRNYKGLNLDSPPLDQPEGTYRFALNAVNASKEGDSNFLTNEESNEIAEHIPEGNVVVGMQYIGDAEIVILSVNEDTGVSEIGVMILTEGYSSYTTIITDEERTDEYGLSFIPYKEAQIVFRLRRGCERTIYFTDDINPPRYFNIDDPESFKTRGKLNPKKFELQKTYSKIPVFNSPIVNDSGGNLLPGSYNFAIQYLDENLNPTEWITSTPVVKIYNDLSTKPYSEINGSINSDVDYLRFPRTSKSIEVSLSSLDTDFVYYRLAIIEATSGTGEISRVLFTDTISTTNRTFVYSGNNALSIGTKEEIKQVTEYIERAGTIVQLENRLLLGNVKGPDNSNCSLQELASAINAECVTKEVNLSSIKDPSNSKNPTQNFGGLGYMPGEIYSFGIVYIFEDGSTTPVFHIPGRSSKDKPEPTTPGTYLMSNIRNECVSTFYTDNKSCNGKSYWGRDIDGTPLVGKNVRHHRFPLRSEIGLPLITSTKGQEQTSEFYNIELNITGNLKTPISCAEDDDTCVEVKRYPFDIRINYKVDNESFFFVESIDPAYYADGENPTYPMNTYQYSQYHGSENITDITVEVTDLSGNYKPAEGFDWSIYFEGEPEINAAPDMTTTKVQGKTYKTEILGIKFSNIRKPNISSGKEITGYYIVRNERTEFDKSILDSAVMAPTVEYNKYISHGLLNPDTDKVNKTVYALIHPENKFNNREYAQFDSIIQQGNFKVEETKLGKVNYDDVYDGTSFVKGSHKDGNDDGHDKDNSATGRGLDGWSFNLISRDNILNYEQKADFTLTPSAIEDIFYLDALASRSIRDNSKDVYNISTDNRVGFVTLTTDKKIPAEDKLPYVVLTKYQSNPYSNYRTLPYYKESLHPKYFEEQGSESITIFNGDSYVTPMRYVSTSFWDNKIAKRKGKGGILKVVLGAFLAVLGAVLTIFTGGSSALVIGAGIAMMGAGALISSAGLKIENANKAYLQEYDKGLRQTALDNWVDKFYNYRNNIPFGYKGNGREGYDGPSDDTIQWIGEAYTDLWFESSVNTSLRNHFATDSSPTYLDSPGRIESGNDSQIGTWEFFGFYYTDSNAQRYPMSDLENHLVNKLLNFDPERDDNRYYIGVALGEYYHINPDYMRKNKEKVFFHLPLEYDCCSYCSEVFPHRIHYSEQSFQEELSDNYRIFLPNNYKDIQGETGPITNMFTMSNNLYVHTSEALWNLPRNYQERVTDQIVSFIGTGSYFEVPPQKIVDMDNGLSAGSVSRGATCKTPLGYLFVDSQQPKVYMFNGQSLNCISDKGLKGWFKENMIKRWDEEHSNPMNPRYSGFTSAYDPEKERVLLTYRVTDYEEGFIKRDNSDIKGVRYGESWTLSFSLLHQSWTSWHSYIPLKLFTISDTLYSLKDGVVWKHGVKGHYQSFYDKVHDHIIEYVSLSSPLVTKIVNHISWQTTASKYIEDFGTFVEDRYSTFDKLVAYNSRQTTGELQLKCRDTGEYNLDYFESQTSNLADNHVLISKNEKDWFLNDIRDIRIMYEAPIWIKSNRLDTDEFIDKVLFEPSLDPQKDWTELEAFRDKFMIVRLYFSNPTQDVKLTTNYTIENEQQSFR